MIGACQVKVKSLKWRQVLQTIDMMRACQVKVKHLKWRQVLQIFDMIGACQVKVKCSKQRQVLQIIDMIGAYQVKVKGLKWRQVLQIIDMIGAYQVKVKCFKNRDRLNKLSTWQVYIGWKLKGTKGTMLKLVAMRHCLLWENLIATTFHISQNRGECAFTKKELKKKSLGRLLRDIDFDKCCFYS